MDEAQWLMHEQKHHAMVDDLTRAHRLRGASGVRHPVEDFLFTYYSHRPARLRRWHPGAQIGLLGPAAQERLDWRWHTEVVLPHGVGVALDVPAYLADRGQSVERTLSLLRATSERPAQLGCFGLHEWAMVHRLSPGEQRHEDWPLRLGQEGTDAVVEAHPLRCSHFDAFRFFTAAAQPLYVLQPTRESQVRLEQPGCLHATMDLYKWAYKLGPAAPSSLTTRCFALVRDVRELDMRASPYDLRALGYEPVAIETAHGRAEYVARQRQFAARGQALRTELIEVCQHLLA